MRFIILPSFNGVTRTGYVLFDADKFGTGVPSEVERFGTEQEARDYVTTAAGVIVELPGVLGDVEKCPSTSLPQPTPRK